MLDIRDESLTHPQPFPLADYRRILVLAAHPDDEVYGCGGLLALAHDAGCDSLVCVFTDGDAGIAASEDVATRRQESDAARAILGYHLEFAGLADRTLRLDAHLRSTIEDLCARHQPDLVLAPSLSDAHPDHQALGLAAIQVLGSPPYRADLAFYETLGSLTTATHILDLTAGYARKQSAMRCFTSQERILPYQQRIEARDCYRAFSLGRAATHAEAYALACLRAHGLPAVLPLLDPLFRHCHLAAAAFPSDLPLVSVLIRSIGDPLLEEALASVLAQTYRPLEIILVAAHARDLTADLPHLEGMPMLRQIVPSQPLDRPAAANAALRAATGRYLLFLDEDDYLHPDHIEHLVACLQAHPHALAAHANILVKDMAGQLRRRYAYTVTRERLLAVNLLPIHAVLFDRRLIDVHRCSFDESLPILEDWDFWLQVAQYTPFVANGKDSAVYRYRDRAGLGSPDKALEVRAQRLRVIAKWRTRLGGPTFDTALYWHALALDDLERLVDRQENEIIKLRQDYETLKHDLQSLRSLLDEVFASTSWRLTAPLRWLAQRMRVER